MPIGNEEFTTTFWKDVVAGQMVELSDASALEDSMKEGIGPKPRKYQITEVFDIVHSSGITWRFLEVDDNIQKLFILIKMVSQDLEVRVYYKPEGFPEGNRQELINNGCQWLFQAPDDENNYKLKDLKFTVEICQKEENEENLYSLKDFGTIYGIKSPGHIFTSITEYQASSNAEDEEILILELGGEKSDLGGHVMMLMGSKISLEEIEIT